MTCPHKCLAGWIDTEEHPDRPTLMPCPRHMLSTHQEWVEGKYRTEFASDALAGTVPSGPATLNGIDEAREAIRAATDIKEATTQEGPNQ